MIIGYARVSKNDQHLDRQIDRLKKEGCERIYQEKVSGAGKLRPELDRMLDALREGDTVIVCELTRLGRSVKELFMLAERIGATGADLRSIKEPWLDTTTPQGKLLFAVFSGVSQLERDIIRERTIDGMESARARGRKGGRPKADAGRIELAMKLYDSRACTVSDILKASGISKATLYAYLKDRESTEKET